MTRNPKVKAPVSQVAHVRLSKEQLTALKFPQNELRMEWNIWPDGREEVRFMVSGDVMPTEAKVTHPHYHNRFEGAAPFFNPVPNIIPENCKRKE